MLRLPDPEPPMAAVPPPGRSARPAPMTTGTHRRRPAVRQVPDPDHGSDPDPDPATAVFEPGPPAGAGGPARNPLFRAIDGGLVGDGDEEQPRPRRGNARRARPSATKARPAAGERTPPREADLGEHLRPECYGCPVGIAFGTVRGASPETLDHLLSASRELVAAARSVMEALESNLERHSRKSPMQHIDLD